MDKLYTCEEVANRYSVKQTTVWAWIREGMISSLKVGKQYRISESALKEFEQKNSQEGNKKDE